MAGVMARRVHQCQVETSDYENGCLMTCRLTNRILPQIWKVVTLSRRPYMTYDAMRITSHKLRTLHSSMKLTMAQNSNFCILIYTKQMSTNGRRAFCIAYNGLLVGSFVSHEECWIAWRKSCKSIPIDIFTGSIDHVASQSAGYNCQSWRLKKLEVNNNRL